MFENLAFLLLKFSLIPAISYFVYVYKKGYMKKLEEDGKTNITNYYGYIILCLGVLYSLYSSLY